MQNASTLSQLKATVRRAVMEDYLTIAIDLFYNYFQTYVTTRHTSTLKVCTLILALRNIFSNGKYYLLYEN